MQELIALLILLKMSPSCKAPTAVNWCNILTEEAVHRPVWCLSSPRGLALGYAATESKRHLYSKKRLPSGTVSASQKSSHPVRSGRVPGFFPWVSRCDEDLLLPATEHGFPERHQAANAADAAHGSRNSNLRELPTRAASRPSRWAPAAAPPRLRPKWSPIMSTSPPRGLGWGPGDAQGRPKGESSRLALWVSRKRKQGRTRGGALFFLFN